MPDQQKTYSIYLAAASHTSQLVILLVELEAKMDAKNDDNKTPLDIAMQKVNDEVIAILRREVL
jgi:ankyrin repeat protein